MKKRFLIFAIAACALSGAGSLAAQINSPQPSGWIERARLMLDDGNPLGTFDQTTFLSRSTLLSNDARAEKEYLRATAALRNGDLTLARNLFTRFISDFPSSPRRGLAAMGIGHVLLAQKNYAAAIGAYSDIPAHSLDASADAELSFGRGYALLMLGDLDAASRAFAEIPATDQRYANDVRFYNAYIAYARGDYRSARSQLKSVVPDGEPTAMTPFLEMEIDFAEGDYKKSLAAAKRLLKTPMATERVAECNRVAGESLYNIGDPTAATPYLWQYAAEVKNPAPSTFYILGAQEFKDGDTDAAIKLLQRVTSEQNAMGQSAYLMLGQSYMKRGDTTSALLAFENAYRMPYNRDVQETAFYNYAVARMDGARVPFGSTVTMLEDFLREFPDSRFAPEVQKYIVEGYMTENDYTAALDALNKVKNPSPELKAARQRVLFVMGTREYSAGQITAARRHLSEVVEMGSVGLDRSILSQSYLWLGDCLYTRGDYDSAAGYYQKYLETAPERDSYNRAIAYYDLGYTRFASQDYTSALTDFHKAIAAGEGGILEPYALADALNRAGDCYYYASRFDDAAQSYSRAYDLNPSAGDYALFQMAVVKGLRGDHNSKINTLNDLMSRFPDTGLVPSALLEKAESQLALGRRNDAIATYRQLVSDYSSTAPGRNGYLQLALTYLGDGRRNDAIDTYKKVIKSYPSSQEAALAADDLKRLYAADGAINKYSEFIETIPEAPRLEAGEAETLSWEAAEEAFSSTGEIDLLAAYIERFPEGKNVAHARYYMAEHAWNSGNATLAIARVNKLLEDFPHAEVAEEAMLLKADAQMSQGKNEPALKTLAALEKQASSANMLHDARLRILRASDALGNSKKALETANALLATTASSNVDSRSEIQYIKGASLQKLGRRNEAWEIWRQLAENPADLYGSMSAVSLAQAQLDNGDKKGARATLDKFIDANPPHQYWLARGFILYSDVLKAQGNHFEAQEYLKSLRSNYPGKDADIFDMINQRLSK